MWKKILMGAAVLVMLAACSDADVASRNISTAADAFDCIANMTGGNTQPAGYGVWCPLDQQTADFLVIGRKQLDRLSDGFDELHAIGVSRFYTQPPVAIGYGKHLTQ